jgi:hypothetical protein
MVRIIGYKERASADGEKFYVLELQGGLEIVKSKQTGRHYATAKTATMTSTFNEDVCKRLVGQEIKGSIKRIDCEPYEYTVKETGEVITLASRWEYLDEASTLGEIVFEGKPEVVMAL